MTEPLETFVELESQVWQALMHADATADRSLLAESFLGVYPSGFADRNDHVGQLDNGPTITRYEIVDTQLRGISADAYLLSYLASFERPGTTGESEQMYVSSLWERSGDDWVNTFSQDTPAELGSST